MHPPVKKVIVFTRQQKKIGLNER